MKKKTLLKKYTSILMDYGLSRTEAKEYARRMFTEAEKNAWINPECRIANTVWCTGMGDYLLSVESQDPDIKRFLDSIREEGATDEDIREYRNLTPIERSMADQVDIFNRMATFLMAIEEKGLMPDEAATEVRKLHPIYGDPADTKHISGEDRPLPPDLKDRINKYLLSWAENAEGLRALIKSHSSMNALIREAMRKGEI